MRPLAVVGVIAITAVASVHATRTPSWAGAKTCITGTGAEVVTDLSQIAAARALIDSVCICSSFDGTLRKTHGSYVACSGGIIGAQVSAGQLRIQCKGTVRKYYAASTCGVLASKDVVPCITTTVSGKVSCGIRPVARCAGLGKVACPAFTSCIDAADTNRDGIIGVGDSGSCASLPAPTTSATQTSKPTPGPSSPTSTTTQTPRTQTATAAATVTKTPTSTSTRTNTPTPTPTITSTPCTIGFADNGNGTMLDCTTKLVWEKKDGGGSIHDKDAYFSWAGRCSVSGYRCQADATAAAACVVATGSAYGCAECEPSEGTCSVESAPATIFSWLAQLNSANFAGHNDWRIPTSAGCCGAPTPQAAELESILAAHYPNCAASPCVPAAFNTTCMPGCTATTCSCTGLDNYWSASSYAPTIGFVWQVDFASGRMSGASMGYAAHVRAVRGP